MKWIVLTLSIGLLLFIGSRFFRSDLSPYHKLSIKIAHETTEQLKMSIPGLHLAGWGGRDQVVYMGFQIRRTIDLDTGRRLILQMSNSYLEAFNSNKKFRPFIRSYPFTIKNLHIDLFFSNPDGSTISPGNICIVALNDGVVGYDGHNPEIRLPHGEYRLITMYKETYEEAVKASLISDQFGADLITMPLVIQKLAAGSRGLSLGPATNF